MKQIAWILGITLLLMAPLAAQDALSIDADGRIWVTLPGSEPLPLETVVVPVGTINAYGGTTDPPGWMICDGRALSSVDYPRLFAAIGTSFGDGSANGDGNSPPPHPQGRQYDFNLPDMRGRFARGLDTTGQNRDPDLSSRTNIQGDPQPGVGGIQEDALEHHNHRIGHRTMMMEGGSNRASMSAPDWDGWDGYWDQNAAIIEDAVVNGNGSSETRPKNVAVNYIINHGEFD